MLWNVTADSGLPSNNVKGQVQAAPVPICVSVKQAQKQTLSILLSSGKTSPANELRKNGRLCKKPQTEMVVLAFLWAAEQSLLCQELKMPWGSQERRILGIIHQEWWLAASQCWEVGGSWAPWRWWYPANSPGLLGEGLVPASTGTHIAQSWLRADPALLQEGMIQGQHTRAAAQRGKEVYLPFLAAGTVKSAVTGPCRP